MLKPSYFYGKSDKAIKYYQDLEDYMLNDIAQFLIRAGELGGKADRELFILQQMGFSNVELVEKIAQISGQSQEAVREVLKDSVMTSFSNDKGVIEHYFKGDFGPLKNPAIVDVINAEWVKTCGELENLTRTTMGQYNADLVTLLNDAEIRVASGTQSYASAICAVLDEYAKKGMVIDYPSGSRRSLESAVRCCVVTSMNQTAAQVTNKYIAEGGIEYVVVSAHAGARHSDKGGIYSHDEWQGKVYKIVGSEAGYPNLAEATGYSIDPVTGQGTVLNPAGLHGYNCRHSHQPWDKDLDNPWLDEDGNPVVDPEESQEVYEKQQVQRSMERSIRQTKRQLNMKRAEIDNLSDDTLEMANAKAEYDELAYKLRQKNARYKEYCANNGLATQADRTKVAGFTKADAQKANGRAKSFSNQKIASGTDVVHKITDKSILNVKKLGNGEEHEFIREKHSEVLKLAMENNSIEVAMLFDKNRDLITSVIGDASGVDLNVAGRSRAKYVMHNHPNNQSFSNRDIVWIVKNPQVEYFSIVKNNGQSELIYIPRDFNDKLLIIEYKRLCKKYSKDIENDSVRGYNKVVNTLLTKTRSGLIYLR